MSNKDPWDHGTHENCDDQNMNELKNMSSKIKISAAGKKRMHQEFEAPRPNQNGQNGHSSKPHVTHLIEEKNMKPEFNGKSLKSWGGDGFRPAFGEGDEGGIDDPFSKTEDDNVGGLKR